MSGLTSGLQRLGKAKTRNKADEIFAYLHKVRVEDDPELSGISEDEDKEYGSPGEKSMAGVLFRADEPVARRIPDKPNITFTSVMPKKSSASKAKNILARIGGIKLGDVDDAIRDITGSPLIRAGALGLLSAGAIYAAYPWLDEPDPRYSALYGGDKAYNTRRDWVTGLTGLGMMGLGIYASKHPNIADSWYRYLPKKDPVPVSSIRKGASMLGPADFVPLGFAQQAIMNSPEMSLDNKYRAVSMLNAIPGGPQTPINSTDIVSAAVNTGSSANGYPLGRAAVGAVADALIGYTVASALGSKNPSRGAALVGLGSFGLNLLKQAF